MYKYYYFTTKKTTNREFFAFWLYFLLPNASNCRKSQSRSVSTGSDDIFSFNLAMSVLLNGLTCTNLYTTKMIFL